MATQIERTLVKTQQIERILLQTQAEVATLKTTLGMLIAWMAQSANSPISARDAGLLLQRLALETPPAADAVDPSADANTGNPATRDEGAS